MSSQWALLLLLLLLQSNSVQAFSPLFSAVAPPQQQQDASPFAEPKPSHILRTNQVVQSVVVAGATGKLGKLVVDELVKRNVSQVIGLVRSQNKALEVYGENIPDNLQLLDCDLTNQQQVSDIVNQCDAAIWCATGFSNAPGTAQAESTSVFGKVKQWLGLGKEPSSDPPPESIDLVGLPLLAESIQTPSTTTTTMTPRVVMCSSAGVTRLTWNTDKQERFVGVSQIPIVRLNPFSILEYVVLVQWVDVCCR